jgi:hypothetical protein
MLVMVFKCLNPSHVKTPPPKIHVEDESLFGALASSEEANESLLKFELFLFQQVVILEDDLKDPLASWKKHECQYPQVGFLAQQILGIQEIRLRSNVFSLLLVC